MENKKRSKYGVNDLGQAAALICAGYEAVDLRAAPDSERIVFYFEPNDEIEATAQLYWAGKLTVDAKQFWQETKNLKTRLYSLR